MSTALPTVSVPDSELRRWPSPSRRPWPLALAMAWVRHAPRGKGWVPRVIGRRVAPGMTATIRTRSGGTVAVDPRHLDIYAWAAVQGGVWEPHIHDTCCAVVRPGDVVLDIGANAGMVTIDLAAHLRGQVRIYAFEPIPSLARGVALSAALSGMSQQITVCETMLGARDGEATLFIPAHAVHASARVREAGSVELKRPVRTLDALVLGGALPPPDFIKIDVEGGELDVFRGAREVLRRHAPAVVLEADENMAASGHSRRDLAACLAEHTPYRFYYVAHGRLTPADDLDAPIDDDHRNMLALPPDRPLPVLPAGPAAG